MSAPSDAQSDDAEQIRLEFAVTETQPDPEAGFKKN